jgi:hypothetical protein
LHHLFSVSALPFVKVNFAGGVSFFVLFRQVVSLGLKTRYSLMMALLVIFFITSVGLELTTDQVIIIKLTATGVEVITQLSLCLEHQIQLFQMDYNSNQLWHLRLITFISLIFCDLPYL